MPHSLSERQKEYLTFLREYIRENEMSPRLEEVAAHFGVKPPTAHRTLEKLMLKGFLIAGRDSKSGYFIRLIEGAGSLEMVIEIPIAGGVNEKGELHDFPKDHGHFPALLIGADPARVFALGVTGDIPNAGMVVGDFLICEYGRRPQPGDIAVIPFSKHSDRLILCRMYSLTMDWDLESLVMSNQYPVPEYLLDSNRGQKFNWTPLVFDKETEQYFLAEAEKEGVPLRPIPPEMVAAKVLRLSRNLAV